MHEDLQRGKALVTQSCPLRTHTQRVLAVPDGSTQHGAELSSSPSTSWRCSEGAVVSEPHGDKEGTDPGWRQPLG